ncbi:zinc finger, CCHC-type [Artemisia annua]|uniref:Zinc finger, CCHC-type n=1 Tax=Artemisia annua TaxID=35608 RepID=A0A2U1PWZ1_ARTAN|nr:zinc finger, CCHC-type [Artemisia annua]PWA90227.1 zinc finger, CCHC-type [Artemisia annua]
MRQNMQHDTSRFFSSVMALLVQHLNNSNFRLILEKEKIFGPNFLGWYCNLRIILKAECKLVYLEKSIPPGPAPTPVVAVEIAAEYIRWLDTYMTPYLQKNLEDFNAYEIPDELKTIFSQHAEQELLETVKAFHICKQEEWQSVSSYVLKMKGYLDKLQHLVTPCQKNLE